MIFMLRHKVAFRLKSIAPSLSRASVYFIVYLSESSIRRFPSASEKIYKTIRGIYGLLPIKIERKRHLAEKVVRRSTLLRDLAIHLEGDKLADNLVAIDGEGNKLADELARTPITTKGASGSRRSLERHA